MKLNTLLLASAATLIASSAFAADLPSKKAAPAAGSVQVCKVGGMTGFTLPGSDTCLQISGRVTADFKNNDTESEYFAGSEDGRVFGDGVIGYRLAFDARSNSDMGMVRSFIRLTNEGSFGAEGPKDGGADKAYIQLGGFTVGVKDSIADIAGTQGNLFGSGWTQSSAGVDYQADVGGLHIGVEAGNRVGQYLTNENATPDFTAHLSGKAGAIGFALAATMVNDGTDSGSAFMGSVNYTAGPAKIFAWGGMSDGSDSSGYITSQYHPEGATTYGAGVTFTASAATSISVQGVHWESDDGDLDLNQYGVHVSHTLAKNLTLQPEVLVSEGTSGTADVDYTSVLLRIQRDF